MRTSLVLCLSLAALGCKKSPPVESTPPAAEAEAQPAPEAPAAPAAPATKKATGVAPGAYAGTWEGEGVHLVVGDDGAVEFSKKSGSTSFSFNGKLEAIDKTGLKVNVLILTKTIEVGEPPHEENGRWTMHVAGAKVWKVEGGGGRGAHLEAAIRNEYTKKGVGVKTVACPSEAETQKAFVCQLTTDLGDQFGVKCLVEGDNADFKIEAALLDPAKLVGMLQPAIAEKAPALAKEGTVAVDCGTKGLIMKRVGDTFPCTLSLGGKTGKATIKVDSLDGKVSADFSL